MRQFFLIWRRELEACFLSAVAYVLMVVFLAVASGTLLMDVVRAPVYDGDLAVAIYEAILIWLTILVTVVSMRLFAEEKRSGTLESLMTLPVTERQVVLGKYAGALSFLVLIVLPVLATVPILVWVSPGIDRSAIDWTALATGGLGLLLVASLCTAVGLVASLLTRNQIIAAVCAFCSVWLVLLAGWLLGQVPGCAPVADYVLVPDHLRQFARGVIDTRALVFYVSGTVFLLFVAVRVLEARRWK
jgi:ABC-2 type transport system permease protein